MTTDDIGPAKKEHRYLLLAVNEIDGQMDMVDSYISKGYAERMYEYSVSKRGRTAEISLYELTEDRMSYTLMYRSTPWTMRDGQADPEKRPPFLPSKP